MAASYAGSVEAVKLLLEAGADVNATDTYQKQTALMWAATEGHTRRREGVARREGGPQRQGGTSRR